MAIEVRHVQARKAENSRHQTSDYSLKQKLHKKRLVVREACEDSDKEQLDDAYKIASLSSQKPSQYSCKYAKMRLIELAKPYANRASCAINDTTYDTKTKAGYPSF